MLFSRGSRQKQRRDLLNTNCQNPGALTNSSILWQISDVRAAPRTAGLHRLHGSNTFGVHLKWLKQRTGGAALHWRLGKSAQQIQAARCLEAQVMQARRHVRTSAPLTASTTGCSHFHPAQHETVCFCWRSPAAAGACPGRQRLPSAGRSLHPAGPASRAGAPPVPSASRPLQIGMDIISKCSVWSRVQWCTGKHCRCTTKHRYKPLHAWWPNGLTVLKLSLFAPCCS